MKKVFNYTAIAAACLVAPVAMAEVTISGVVDQAFDKLTNSNASGRKTVSRLEPTLSNYGELKFKGTEEIGSGTKANFEVSLKNVGPADADESIENYTSFVGLSGDFGSIKIGSQWRPFFTAVSGIDPAQLAKVPGFVGSSLLGGLSGMAPTPNRNSITYNLPSLTPGLFIQLQKGLSETSTGIGDNKGMYAIFTDGDKFFAAYATNQTTMLAYDPTTGAGTFGAALTGSMGQDGTTEAATTWANPTNSSSGHNHVLHTASAGDVRKSSGVAFTYKVDTIKLVYASAKEKVVGQDAAIDLNAYGFTVPFGSDFSLGYLVSTANHTRSADLVASGLGRQFRLEGNRMLVSYSMSKRTTAYFASGRQKLAGGTVNGTALSTEVAALGIQHKF